MIRRLLGLVVVLSFGLISCGGVELGSFESLEAEMDAAEAKLVTVAGEALGELEVVARDSGPLICDPSDAWAAVVDVIVVSPGEAPFQTRERLLRWLEFEDVAFKENLAPGSFGYTVSFEAGLSKPVAVDTGETFGLRLGTTTACYEPERIIADPVSDLRHRTNIGWTLARVPGEFDPNPPE